MKNKKAVRLLGGHVLNIVLAVLVLLVLVYVGIRVFGIFTDKSNLEKAENNLNSFVNDFENFINGNKDKEEIMILGPKKWHVLFYHESRHRPNDCEGYEFCACLCNKNEVDECNKVNMGVCLDLKYEWKGENNYKIKEVPFSIEVSKDG